ncbi:sensor histidine kinase [Ramlibacter albus]|uniref:histidine kinase n=1 Tax=Ramlibacter albus TaxID=2079448 RepID=A0A923S411_9BURK|nr:sensor histidine kinase [Ramlibacter albus]MBC5767015.1 HAMP domain-containing protein [Ramlibacter albus]
MRVPRPALATAALDAWNRQPVRRQLAALVVATALPFVALVALLLYLGAKEVETRTLAAAAAEARGMAVQVEASLAGSRRALEALAVLAPVQKMDPRRCDPALAAVAAGGQGIVQIAQVDLAGNAFCLTTRPGATVAVADREWFRQAMGERAFRLGEPVVGRASGKWVVTAVQPVSNPNGDPAGLLVAGIDLEALVAATRHLLLPEGSVSTVISARGVVISRSHDNELWAGRDVSTHRLFARQRLLGEGELVAQGLDGVQRVYAVRTLPSTGWLLSVAIPVDALAGPASRRLRGAMLVSLVVLLGGLGVAAWIGNGLARPLVLLAAAAQAMADGCHPDALPERGARELAVASRAFNHMQASRAAAEASLALRNEQLDAANKELEAFSYSVSHDLRAPVRAIDGFSLALANGHAAGLDAQGKACVQRVRDATQRMASLIDDMLALSRSTRAEVHVEPVDVSALARCAAGELLAGVRDAPLVGIADGVTAMADSLLLRSVLDNLFSNAIKFTGRTEGARIDFTAQVDAGQVVCTVRDNGAGFDEAFAANLFSPFFRLHRATEYPGNGIGLATVKRIVGRMGGRVWAHGRPGRGASFSFSLPAAPAA